MINPNGGVEYYIICVGCVLNNDDYDDADDDEAGGRGGGWME